MSLSLSDQPYARVRELLAGYDRPWFLCGGWAADFWLGRKTRDHGDVDVSFFDEDQAVTYAYLKDWHLVAHDELVPVTADFWDGRTLVLPAHVHALPPGERHREAMISWVTPPYKPVEISEPYYDLMFNERIGSDWLLDPPFMAPGPSRSDLPTIPVSLALAVRQVDGLSIAAPEILMFFKATSYRDSPKYPREHDRSDFLALLPGLSEDRREWLRDAIATFVPEHPWLEHLA